MKSYIGLYILPFINYGCFSLSRYVKDRRPSISPNFNFLGQLVEFDSQLTKQQADDCKQLSPQTSQSSEVNVEMPERAPSPSKRPCMINLSRAVQSRRSSAVVTSVQSPTTALSRLQFVDQRQASSATAVNVRPSSDGLIAQSPPTFQPKSTSSDASAGVTQPAEQVGSPPSSSSSSSSVAWSRQTGSTTRRGDALPVGTDSDHPAKGSSARDMLLVDWQTSFKSRSLEDILLESTSPPRSLQGHVTSHWTPGNESGDGSSSRLAGHASLAASHGSLSNGHASLHGSLEMIQVS